MATMFTDRFEGSLRPIGSRPDVSFRPRLMLLGPLKDEWRFIEDETLRCNIAAELQKLHFDILLVNEYNVYYSPEAMTLKHAIIAAASVAEAVLEVAVKMMEDDPRIAAIIQTKEQVFEEFKELSLTGFTVPEGLRVVAGVQREVVKGKLDRHTKMDLLIRAAKQGEIIDEGMAKKLQQLRRFRNRVHIKSVEELEYFAYKHAVANGMLDILEEFRLAMAVWFNNQRAEEFMKALTQVGPPATQWATAAEYEINDPDDDIPF